MLKTKQIKPPGRPKDGFARAVRVLNEVLVKPGNLKKLHSSLQDSFDADPAAFLATYQTLIAAKQPRRKLADTVTVELQLPKAQTPAQQYEIPLHDVEFATNKSGIVKGVTRKAGTRLFKGGRKVKAK